MTQSVLERTGDQIAETARKASRATSAVADAFDDGVAAARRVAKQSGDAAEEFMDDTTRRLQRHPVETMVAAFATGIAVGIAIGWMVKRK
jgi:F0F1-type ATP synthase assembly protein I